jgi:malyl-CoA/(S)-citramalyl-CoA lyase
MSFKTITLAPDRLNRSELAVPGSNPKLFEKAAKSAADVIFLDLEDAVAPDDKPQARKNIIAAIGDMDWGNKVLAVRINGLDTHFMYRDVVDVLEQASDRLDLIMIPKGRKKKVGFELIIETALGMQNINEIAVASPRNESLHFGVADYAASTRARTTSIGGANADYAILTDGDTRDLHWGDMWHYAISRMVVAARANGLRAVDGPFGNFSDAEGYRAAARRAAVLGCEGKWAIHPSQIALGNEVFSPSEKDVGQARRIIAAMKQAEAEGKGAVSLDGRLIDYASIRQAEVLISKAEKIAAQ